MNIFERFHELTNTFSSSSIHVNMREEANLMNTEMCPVVRGSQEVCISRAEGGVLSIYTSPQDK